MCVCVCGQRFGARFLTPTCSVSECVNSREIAGDVMLQGGRVRRGLGAFEEMCGLRGERERVYW